MTTQGDPAGDPAVRERQALRQVTDRLSRSFAGTYSSDQVDRTVAAIHQHFDERPVRDFVPILVERMARERLQSSDG